MKFGVATFFTDQGIGPALLALALEERGFDSLFVTEHSHVPASRRTPFPGGGELPEKYYRMLDPFLALTAAATVTNTLLLGTGVALVAQRDPIITAKEVATLDLLSNGRLLFGAGIGWNREEMESHGIDPTTRGKLTDELIEAMLAIWTREIAEYHGEFVNLDPLFAWPKPVQRPHPPLYFGGGTAAFPRIARFGAGWYAVSPGSDELAASMAQLRAVTGTDTAVTAAHVGPVTEAALRGYTDSGVERVVFDLETLSEGETLVQLDEYVALTRELGWSPSGSAPEPGRGVPHSAVTLEDTTMIEVFTPIPDFPTNEVRTT